MARKKIPAVPSKKMQSPRLTQACRTQPPRAAHPRLVHGFLVRPASKAITPAARAAKSALPTAANDSVENSRAHRGPDARLEGPPDDATFH